jgi:hypothetical protein
MHARRLQGQHIQNLAVVGSNLVAAAGGDVDAVAAASASWLQRARLLTNSTSQTAALQHELMKSTPFSQKAEMAEASMPAAALVEKAQHGLQADVSMALKGLGCHGIDGFSTKDQHIRRQAAKQQQLEKAQKAQRASFGIRHAFLNVQLVMGLLA